MMSLLRRTLWASGVPLALGCTLALCGSLAPGGSPAVAEDSTDTLRSLKENGYIAVGYREDAIPFSYAGKPGEALGFTVDLCREAIGVLKADLGMPSLEIRMIKVTTVNRIAMLLEGQIDLECGATANTVERQEQVAFAPTHFLARPVFAARASAALKTIADLAGKRVVAQARSVEMEALRDINAQRQLGMRLLPARDPDGAFLIAEYRGADAVVLDDVELAARIAASDNPTAFRLSDDGLGPAIPYGIMMRKGDAAFKTKFDRALASILSGPAAEGLYARWFTSPIPPGGITLRLPMGAALQKAYARPTDSPNPGDY